MIQKTYGLLPVLLAAAPLTAQAQTCTAKPDPNVSLVVFVAADQMRADYLDRYRSQFTGGLRLLRDSGAFYPNAVQQQAITETAAGHASMLSGRFPVHTNIPLNDPGVFDPAYPLVGMPTPAERRGASPARFMGTTLFDWLRVQDSAARALSVSRKDRGAILPIGRSAQNVFWFNSGRFTSSTWYMSQLPEWVKRFDAELNPDAWKGHRWDLLLPDSAYAEPDSTPWEAGGRGFTFPHDLGSDSLAFARGIERQPWMDSLTLALALRGVRELGIGNRSPGRGAPDLLSVSLSTTDAVGHTFGPESREIHDQVLRLDRWLGVFFDSLSTIIPRDRMIIAFTADHGSSSLPEMFAARGMDGGRVRISALGDSLRRAMRTRWGTDFAIRFADGLLLADTSAMHARGIDVRAVSDSMAARMRRMHGVRRVFTPVSLRTAAAPDSDAVYWRHLLPVATEWLTAAMPSENWWFGGGTEVDHGSMHAASRSIPIAIVAPGVPARTHPDVARSVDIAPTLASLIGVCPTEPIDGKILNVGSTRR